MEQDIPEQVVKVFDGADKVVNGNIEVMALAGIETTKDNISRDGRFYSIKHGYIKGNHIPTTIKQFRQ